MTDKKPSRLRRAAKTRARIRRQEAARLTVHRTNLHIYAQVIAADGAKVLASASTLEKEVRAEHPNGGPPPLDREFSISVPRKRSTARSLSAERTL